MPKNVNKPFFLKKLHEEFKIKKEKNKRYSLRQYARFLNINSGTLSAILQGKRTIPSGLIETVVKRLALSEYENKQFVRSISLAQKYKENFFEITPDCHARFYEELEYFIILSLFKRASFKAKPHVISQETGIGQDRLEKYLDELLSAGLLQISDDGNIQRSTAIHVMQEGYPPPLRRNQKNNLKMTVENFEKLSFEEYEYSHVTLYLDQKGFESLRKDVRFVRDQINNKEQCDNGGRLYRVALQIFPITKI